MINENLSILFQKTRIPKAIFVREALKDLFKKYDSISNTVDGNGIILKNCGQEQKLKVHGLDGRNLFIGVIM
jgi:hypothetical protein